MFIYSRKMQKKEEVDDGGVAENKRFLLLSTRVSVKAFPHSLPGR